MERVTGIFQAQDNIPAWCDRIISGKRYIVALSSITAVTLILHCRHAMNVIGLSASLDTPLYWMYDTESYSLCADAILQGIPLSPAFQERLLVPALLAAIRFIGWPDYMFLWIPVVLHVCCVPAVAFLGRYISGYKSVAIMAALIYCIFPHLYQYTPEIGTDMLNTQFMLLAVALTLMWCARGVKAAWWGAGLCWMAAQLTRPTCFFIGPVLLVLLIPALVTGKRKAAILLTLMTLIVPAGMSVFNYTMYRVAAPTLCKPELLHRAAVPHVKAFKRLQENGGRLSSYWYEERDVIASSDPDWKALQLYTPGFRDRETFKMHYDALIRKSESYLKNNRMWLIRTAWFPIRHVLFKAPSYYPARYSQPEGNQLHYFIWRGHILFLMFGCIGLIGAIRHHPFLVLFVLGVAAMVVLPCAFFMWVMSSARLPVDLLLLPFAAYAVLCIISWLIISLTGLAGWLPVRLNVLPPWSLLLVTGIVLGVYLFREIWLALPYWWTRIQAGVCTSRLQPDKG